MTGVEGDLGGRRRRLAAESEHDRGEVADGRGLDGVMSRELAGDGDSPAVGGGEDEPFLVRADGEDVTPGVAIDINRVAIDATF